MVQLKKQAHFKGKVALVVKAPYAGSGPRGIDVYARLLSEMLSRDLPSDSLVVARDQLGLSPVDLVHYTFFDPFFLTLWGKTPRRTPYVVTIHDMIPLRYPTHFPAGLRGKLKFFLQSRALLKASAIITDSHASKKDIVRFINYPETRIHVIPLAGSHKLASLALCKSVQKEYNLPQSFVLYVGDINWNKNIPSLIKAFAGSAPPDTHLVLVGKAFVSDKSSTSAQAIRGALASVNCQDRIHRLGFVPTHHLSALYKLAALYVQPSWYEGFGFPVIEAMTQGTPVLSSNQGSLPEVGGQYVHYFDPNQAGDLERTLSKLLKDPSQKDKYLDAAKIWAKQFSWQQVAKSTVAVYAKYAH